MSSDSNFAAEMKCCASCGITENDDIKLKKCTACYLVKYCSIKCQKNHWSQHKRVCRLRAAELRDEILFKQPESSHIGDCPLCMIPLKIDGSDCATMACCSKFVCNGCSFANQTQEREMRLEHKCPFCRHPAPKSQMEAALVFKEKDRVEMNDPIALRKVGVLRYQEGDHKGTFEFWTKAADLGDLQAHYQLSILYHNSYGVKKNEKKETYHLEKAAIGGHPIARYNLGCIEGQNGRHERAVRHFIIAASQGEDDSLRSLKVLYQDGKVGKEDLAAAIRAHQAAVDATKSPQRDAAAAFIRAGTA